MTSNWISLWQSKVFCKAKQVNGITEIYHKHSISCIKLACHTEGLCSFPDRSKSLRPHHIDSTFFIRLLWLNDMGRCWRPYGLTSVSQPKNKILIETDKTWKLLESALIMHKRNYLRSYFIHWVQQLESSWNWVLMRSLGVVQGFLCYSDDWPSYYVR